MGHYSAYNNVHLYLILLLEPWLPAGDADCPGWVTRSDHQAAGVSAGGPWRLHIHRASKVTAPKSHLTHRPFGEVLGRESPPPRAEHSAMHWAEVGSPGAPVHSQMPPICSFAWIKCKSRFLESPLPKWEVKLFAVGSWNLWQSPACRQICEVREDRRPSSDLIHLHITPWDCRKKKKLTYK